MPRYIRRIFTFITISVGVRVLFGAAVLVSGFVVIPEIGNQQSDSTTAPVSQTRPKQSDKQGSTSKNDLTPDALNESAKLVAPDGAVFDGLGFSVAVSGDTAIVAADRDDDYKGAAYIFTGTGTSWSLQQKLTGVDSVPEDNFGWSVAISGDTAVVGASLDDVGGVDQGSVYIFTRSGTVWSQQQKLNASDAAPNDQFGISVAISGETVVVGAFGDDGFRGAAYVFTRSGIVWSEQQKLIASDGAADDEFGWSVGASNETAVVGASRDDGAKGSAYVFTRAGTAWSQQQKLTASDASALDQFGYSVAVSGDTALFGAVFDDTAGAAKGSAYVFTRSGSLWSQQQKLSASDGAASDNFGGSVAIGNDTVVVGSNGDDIGPNGDQGAAYLFLRTGEVWAEQQKLTASDGAAGDNFGGSVAISGDTVVIGGYLDDSGSTLDQGSAYIFTGALQVTPTPTATATPTVTPTATPAISPTPTPTPTPGQGFEGDISERPNGDGFVLSNDITQLRRFVVGLDVPVTTANEFQRADIAPLATAGDGSIDAADTIQSRRYIAGLDPLQAAGGPTEATIAAKSSGSIIDRAYDFFSGREVRVTPGTVSAAGRVSISIDAVSYGDETGASFTLEFDAAKLRNPRVTLAETAPEGTVLTVNADQADGGRVGILIDSDTPIGVGTARQLVTVTFDVAANAETGNTLIRFSDSLAPTSITDAVGNSLAVRYMDGTLYISGTAGAVIDLSGRVTTPDGRGLRNAIVTITDSLGAARTATTGSFGNYSFTEITPGQTYTIAVSSKRYRFAPRILNLSDSLADVDFLALE